MPKEQHIILGIETSCDETSVAIVQDGWRVLSNVIASQVVLHNMTGGIVPEVAAREQVEHIVPCIKEALRLASLSSFDSAQDDKLAHRDNWANIDAVAVTRGPGLIGSLLTGVNAARTLAWVLDKPLVGVNHIEGHIYGNWLGETQRDIKFPIVILTASGGHNELVLMKGHGNFTLIGETLDDAAGEAFDKVARILGLGYPGGPAIARAAERGNKNAVHFPRAWLQDPSARLGVTRPKEITNFNFSFSGLKAAVLREVERDGARNGRNGVNTVPTVTRVRGDNTVQENDKRRADPAASFQEAVVDVLATKAVAAAKKFGAAELHLSGGVSANTALRQKVAEMLAGTIPLRFPEKIEYCTDNAAMIAAAGYFRFMNGHRDDWKSLEATPVLPLSAYVS